MMRLLQRWLREPLLHFLALGTLMFGLYTWRSGGLGEKPGEHIEIEAADIDGMRQKWIATWGRPPTGDELQGLVDQRVREEVLYREALAMSLDQDDVIVRRRLAQKVEFLLEDVALLSEPTEEELVSYFERNPDVYRIPTSLSFRHIYFSPERNGGSAERDARELRARLRATLPPPEETTELGDRIMLPHDLERQTPTDIERLFGPGFAEEVFALPTGDWQGPVGSSYGLHLVRVAAREEARIPDYEEVRDRVRRDFDAARREDANEQLYGSLRDRYRVTIDESAVEPRRELASRALGEEEAR